MGLSGLYLCIEIGFKQLLKLFDFHFNIRAFWEKSASFTTFFLVRLMKVTLQPATSFWVCSLIFISMI